MRITVENAGPDEATLHVLPTLWFRNTWSWGYPDHAARRRCRARRRPRWSAATTRSGSLVLVGDGEPEPLFCDNETNAERLFGEPNATPLPEGRHQRPRRARRAPPSTRTRQGTKAALHYSARPCPPASPAWSGSGWSAPTDAADPRRRPWTSTPRFDAVVAGRRPRPTSSTPRSPRAGVGRRGAVLRQAFAGLLWGKQFYHYDVTRWLDGDPGQPPPPPGRGAIRNGGWPHLNNHEVLLMPDPWEYPWFAAWDLAFHCVTLAHIDPAFAKDQLVLLLREWYMHPNGQIPAYEWNFSDVNPPVHAWAALRVFELDGAHATSRSWPGSSTSC